MSKTLFWKVNTQINGVQEINYTRESVRAFGRELGTIPSKAQEVRNSLVSLGSVSSIIKGVREGFTALASVMGEMTAAYQVQEEAELKLQTIMRQRMSATDEDIDSIKRLASAQQELGVIGDEVQLAGAQQVATFLTQRQSLEALLPAMNNLAAQQKGLNVTSQDMVNIGNMFGKVMQGQTAALRRVGITFDASQEKILKYGTEEQKAATLAEVITQNVGNMNAELAKTDAGKAKQMANNFGDMQEQIGKAFAQYEVYLQGFSQIGMIVTGLGQLTTGLRALARTLGITTLASNALKATWTWSKKNIPILRQAIVEMAFAEQLEGKSALAAAASTTLFKNAIRGLLIATGVGAALVALGVAFDAFASRSEEAATAVDGANKSMDETSDVAEEARKQIASQVGAYRQAIMQAASFKGSKEDEKKAVAELNSKYGDTLGTYSKMSEWYKVLTNNSETYTKQLYAQAKMQILVNRAAEKELEISELEKAHPDLKGTKATINGRDVTLANVGAKPTNDNPYNYPQPDFSHVDIKKGADGNVVISDAEQRHSGLVKGLEEDNAAIKETQEELDSISFDKSGAGNTATTKTGEGGKTDTKVFNSAAVTTKEISDNISVLQDKLSNTKPDTEEYKAVSDAIKVWQDRLDDINRGYEKGSLADYEQQVADVNDQLKNLNLTEAERNELISKRTALQAKADAISNAGVEKGSLDDLNNQMQELQRQFNATGSLEARLKIKAQINDLQQQIDEATNGKLTIPAEPEPDSNTANQLGSYQNAQSHAQNIQQKFEIGAIGADEARKQIDSLNEQLEGLGLKPIDIKFETDEEKAKKDLEDLTDSLRSSLGGSITQAVNQWAKLGDCLNKGGSAATGAAAGMVLVGQSLEQMGADGAVAKIGATLAAIGQIALGFASAAASPAVTSTGWGWLAFVGAGLAAMATAVATIQSYATGGIVPGSSYYGDRVTAHVNSGEMILNQQQQRRLFAIANGDVLPQVAAPVASAVNAGINASGVAGSGVIDSGRVLWRVQGRDLVGVLANETRIASKSGRRTGIKI